VAVSPPERRAAGAGPFVLAAALPFLFLHRNYQPVVAVGHVDADLSDLAVLAVVVAGILELRVRRRLPGPRAAWIAWLALAVAVPLWTLWGMHFAGYPFGTHATTAAKWIEYMLLAPAVAAIVRREQDLQPALAVLLAWSVVASVVGVLQFFGAVGNLDHTHIYRTNFE